MVLKSAFAAVLCTGFLALGGAAVADEYRPEGLVLAAAGKVGFVERRPLCANVKRRYSCPTE